MKVSIFNEKQCISFQSWLGLREKACAETLNKGADAETLISGSG
jgi:hypothetical protein